LSEGKYVTIVAIEGTNRGVKYSKNHKNIKITRKIKNHKNNYEKNHVKIKKSLKQSKISTKLKKIQKSRTQFSM